MSWNKWIRQVHRWLSLVFTAAVILNVAIMMLGNTAAGAPGGQPGEPPLWAGLMALIPLILLLLTGLYLFVLPYTVKWRGGRAGRQME